MSAKGTHLPIHLDVVQSLVFRPWLSLLRFSLQDGFVLRARPPFILPVAATAALSSVQFDHVQVVERHEVSVAAENVHEALGVDHADVAVTSRRFGTSDEAEFVLVMVCSALVVRSKVLLSLLHLLVVQVKAVVRILNDERVHHGDGRGRAKAVTVRCSTLSCSGCGGAKAARLHW